MYGLKSSVSHRDLIFGALFDNDTPELFVLIDLFSGALPPPVTLPKLKTSEVDTGRRVTESAALTEELAIFGFCLKLCYVVPRN
jgi:hypothetical protein